MKFNDRNTLLLILFFVAAPCFTVSGQQPNGGIITLKGDTVLCNIASKPWDAGLKKKKRDAYLFDCVVAIFPTDSVRLLYPQHISGFFLKSGEQNNPQINWYFSDSVNRKHDLIFKNPPRMRPVFLRQLVSGGFYHLWYFEEADPGDPNDRVFILEEVSTGRRHIFNKSRQLRKLLGKWPGSGNRGADHKDWLKEKQLMVIDYNKYKAGE